MNGWMDGWMDGAGHLRMRCIGLLVKRLVGILINFAALYHPVVGGRELVS